VRAATVALLLAGSTALGCTTTAPGPGAPQTAELREMKARILELQRAVTVHEVEIERLRRQLATLESGASSPALPPPAPGPRPPASESRPWRPEPVEQSDLALDAPEPAVRQAPPVAAPRPPAGPPGGGAPPAPGAEELYDLGYTLYHQGRYVDAESSFQRFLQAWPESDLADNAHYWMGEARLARGDAAGALAAFRETVERYPAGNKVPDAMVKAGDCLARLGDVEGARAQYAEVGRRFPETAAAAVAAERRAKLR